jgi:hypothetical protein
MCHACHLFSPAPCDIGKSLTDGLLLRIKEKSQDLPFSVINIYLAETQPLSYILDEIIIIFRSEHSISFHGIPCKAFGKISSKRKPFKELTLLLSIILKGMHMKTG